MSTREEHPNTHPPTHTRVRVHACTPINRKRFPAQAAVQNEMPKETSGIESSGTDIPLSPGPPPTHTLRFPHTYSPRTTHSLEAAHLQEAKCAKLEVPPGKPAVPARSPPATGLCLKERGPQGSAANTCNTGWPRLGKWLGGRRQRLQNHCTQLELDTKRNCVTFRTKTGPKLRFAVDFRVSEIFSACKWGYACIGW